MTKYAIDFEKVNKFVFGDDFITNEIVENYELLEDDENDLKLTSRQVHEIKNNSLDASNLRLSFLNQFIEEFKSGEYSDECFDTLKANGFLKEI